MQIPVAIDSLHQVYLESQENLLQNWLGNNRRRNNDEGEYLILCLAYTFPYESHPPFKPRRRDPLPKIEGNPKQKQNGNYSCVLLRNFTCLKPH